MKNIELLPLLKNYFGFTSFRPLQQEIIQDILNHQDVFALLPTGGGKSLCFQLPALAMDGLTLVVSPLIALMKDQVDALQASGIAATYLNSSLEADESRERLRGLFNHEYRLLYFAPERLMLPAFLEMLQKWKINLLAIDEAHCISEWGHDFRPEYRELEKLRQLFPEIPVVALTATATERVRTDILHHLKLKSPHCYVASFNRPNLSYRVIPKEKPYDQTLQFIEGRPKESGIIYCQSRKSAERIAERLNIDGIKAKPYHAGLSSAERSKHQELFLRDEVQVICATIAFGMGINKPNVRFVLHYDLPKNIEGYYQETGRAGRDSLPAECLLLFSPGDVVKQLRFIEEKTDLQEQQIARAQLQQMIHYAEGSSCRRSQLLQYFGETFEEENCKGCDNCLSPRPVFDGTVSAQKVLSCIYRIREKSGFGVGLNHIIEVLTGADTEKIRRLNHTTLSTYGIGKEQNRSEWGSIARELIRLGFISQSKGQFTVLELTQKGINALKQRSQIFLTRSMNLVKEKLKKEETEFDETLFDLLRQLRRQLADDRDVPAYIIFSDNALRQMARDYPQNDREFSKISGVGGKKLKEFGKIFQKEILNYLQEHPRISFKDDATSLPSLSSTKKGISNTIYVTLLRFRAGDSIEKIATERELTTGTIYGHLAEAVLRGEKIEIKRILNAEDQRKINSAFEKVTPANLSGAIELLGDAYDYGQLKLYRAFQIANEISEKI